jgi:hypothetical protein
MSKYFYLQVFEYFNLSYNHEYIKYFMFNNKFRMRMYYSYDHLLQFYNFKSIITGQ